MLEHAVIGEQQQAFAVTIQAAGGINTGNRNEVFQRMLPAELAQDIVRFVEEDVAVGQALHHN